MGAAGPDTIGRATAGDVFVWQPPAGATYDLIFVDPPYALLPQFGATLLARAAAWLAPGGEARLLLEAPGEYEPIPPPGWVLARRLGKGKRQPNSLIFARAE
jgi:16S rRNA G966 N2-methylase RsmD